MKIFASQALRVLFLTYAAYVIGHVMPVWLVKPLYAALVMVMLLMTFAQVYRPWLRRNQCAFILLTAVLLWPSLTTDPGAPLVNILAWLVEKLGAVGTASALLALVLARRPLKIKRRRPLPEVVRKFLEGQQQQAEPTAEPEPELEEVYAPEPVEVVEPEPVAPPAPEPVPEPARKPRTVKPDPSTLSSRRPAGVRVYLNNEFKDNDVVKALGARFDPEKKLWYVPNNISLKPFRDWLPAA